MELLSMLGTLLLMVLIFVGAYYVSKLAGKGFTPNLKQSGGLRIVDKVMLGKDRFLLTVRSGEKAYLLGVTQQQITKIDEIDPALLPPETMQVPKTEFISVFQKAWKQRNGQKNEGEGNHYDG